MSEEPEDSLEPAVFDPLKCGKCGYGAKSVGGLKTHQRGQQCRRNQGISVTATFKCGVCGRLFESQHGLSIHKVTHGSQHRADLAAPFEEDVDKVQEECQGNVEVFRGRMLQWKASFLRLANGREVDPNELDELISGFTDELAKCIDFLPGPRNPNKKFIDLRKKTRRRKVKDQQAATRTGYATTTNPSRTSKRKKAERKEQLTYDRVQFDYYNQRRRVIRAVAGSDTKKCPIKMENLVEAFEPRFAAEKTNERAEYQSISNGEQAIIDASFECKVSMSDVRDAVKGIAVDSAAGPDRVLVRVIKQEAVMKVLAVVATVLLEVNAKKEQPLPSALQLARTVLIHKGGDVTDANNYRPISICSAIRRVLERVVDRHLRRYVSVSRFQQGFTSAPGTHVNASILGSVLKKAQVEKTTVVVVLLDIKRAFEEIPHVHLKKTLSASPLPTPLRNFILSLQNSNRTQLDVAGQRSQAISVKKGVFQGAPLSPMLYNISTDYVTRSMTEVPIAEEYGFFLCEGEQPLTFLGFADDSTLVAKSREAAVQLTEMAIGLFKEIGLEVSAAKSKAIIVEKGVLSEVPLSLFSGDVIEATKRREKVRYLGATVTDQLDFDQDKVIRQLTEQVDRLVHFRTFMLTRNSTF